MTYANQTIRTLGAAAKNSFISRLTVIPPLYRAAQILFTSFFTMYFFVLLAEFIGNPEVTVTYVVIGNAVQSVAATTLYSVAEIPNVEKHTGTIESLTHSPSSLFVIFLGMSSFSIVTGMASMLVSLGYAAFVFGVSFAACNFLSVAVVMIFTCFSLTGVGMLIGGVGIHLRTSAIAANIVAYIGLLISGVNFPVSYLPGWVQVISDFFPLTYAVEATRDAVNGASISGILEPLGIMVALGSVFLVLSWYGLKFFEKKSRIAGKMDSF